MLRRISKGEKIKETKRGRRGASDLEGEVLGGFYVLHFERVFVGKLNGE